MQSLRPYGLRFAKMTRSTRANKREGRRHRFCTIETQLARNCHKVTQPLCSRFLADIQPVRFNRPHRELKTPGDILVRKSTADEAQNLDLPSCQPETTGNTGRGTWSMESRMNEAAREICAAADCGMNCMDELDR